MALTRRVLLLSGVAVGGGLGLLYTARRLDDGDAVRKFAAAAPGSQALNAWVRIAPDGAITCGVHRTEMGQGVTTSLPMLIAEEMDAEWSRVRYEFTPLDKDYFNFGILLRGQPLGPTDGRVLAGVGTALIREVFHQLGMSMTISSSSTVDAWDTLRAAGASARGMLVAAAARRWNVPAAQLRTAESKVFDPASGHEAGYGELADAAAREAPPSRPPLKSPAEFRLIGASLPRLDVPAKVNGTAQFGIDTRRDGMLFGAVRHAATTGGTIGEIDDAAALKVAGVKRVLRLGDRAVAVLATDTWSAFRGAERLEIPRDAARPVQPDTAALLGAYHAALDDPAASVFRSDGDVAAALASGDSREAVFELPFLAHACMEPMNCSALYAGGQLTLWAPTQAPSVARDEAARAAGIDPADVDVVQTLAGGGFGRRAEMDFVVEAALAAMAVPGQPVKLTWPRAEDIRHGTFRPAAVARIRGAVDRQGMIAALDYTLVSESVVASYDKRTPSPRGGEAAKDRSALGGIIELRYPVPNLRLAYVPRDDGMPVGFWRSVSNSINPFPLEAFVDELAAAAGADPLEFRLAHLAGHPAEQAVLRAAAKLGRWGVPLAAGRGRGLAFIESHDTLVAQVIEVTVSDAGALRVDKIACVVDCRTVIHPDNVIAQISGGILDGLNAAMHGRVSVRDGLVEQRNFDDYPWLRIGDVPEIVVELLPQGGRPGGVGEPGVPAVAPALVNAIYSATGQRIRTLPVGWTLAHTPGA
jgi:isoquinoline 1-oxidoreductase beta subunit